MSKIISLIRRRPGSTPTELSKLVTPKHPRQTFSSRSRKRKSVLSSYLCRLAAQGRINRFHEPSKFKGHSRVWRYYPAEAARVSLMPTATAGGVTTTQKWGQHTLSLRLDLPPGAVVTFPQTKRFPELVAELLPHLPPEEVRAILAAVVGARLL